jgi:hypothetical protein
MESLDKPGCVICGTTTHWQAVCNRCTSVWTLRAVTAKVREAEHAHRRAQCKPCRCCGRKVNRTPPDWGHWSAGLCRICYQTACFHG